MENRGNQRQAIGRQGEEIACKLLCQKGHSILERNYRSGHLEIDIISFAADGIHFVEVKSRCKNIQALPQENVGHLKQRRVAIAAKRFLKSSKGLPFCCEECHFDVVAVVFTENETTTEYIADAYIPIYT